MLEELCTFESPFCHATNEEERNEWYCLSQPLTIVPKDLLEEKLLNDTIKNNYICIIEYDKACFKTCLEQLGHAWVCGDLLLQHVTSVATPYLLFHYRL